MHSEHRAAPVPRLDVQKPRAFETVVLDIDLGISAIDGIEWLAERRGTLVARKVATLATQERDGAIPAERAYAERLAAIRPRRDEVDALSRAYVDALAADCVETVNRFRRAGVRLIVVSRGLRHAMYRLAFRLGLDPEDVHAVDVRFDAVGAYTGFDHTSPLITAAGKRSVLASLDVERPMLVVGGAPTERAFESFAHLASIVLP